MKLRALTLAAALALPFAASAAEPVKFEVYLGGELKHSISLAGPHSKFKFSPAGLADTTLEFRLIAPEPLILEMTESTANNTAPENVGLMSLIKPRSSVTYSDSKCTHVKHHSVRVRAQ